MTHGESEIDLQSSDVARFYECQKSRTNVRARAAEGFNKTYGIVFMYSLSMPVVPGQDHPAMQRLRAVSPARSAAD